MRESQEDKDLLLTRLVVNKVATEEELKKYAEMEPRLKSVLENIIRKENELKEITRRKRISYHQQHPHSGIYNIAKSNAVKLGISFDITKEDIKIPEYCPYLDIKITYKKGEGRVPSNASISRIDLRRGYVKGNIQIISDAANRLIHKLPEDQLITFCKNFLHLHSKPTLHNMKID